MAGVEPYAPCPCGSGQKFKWCCQKVESYADKAQRLFDGNQAEAAVKLLDRASRKGLIHRNAAARHKSRLAKAAQQG